MVQERCAIACGALDSFPIGHRCSIRTLDIDGINSFVFHFYNLECAPADRLGLWVSQAIQAVKRIRNRTKVQESLDQELAQKSRKFRNDELIVSSTFLVRR